MKKLVFFLLLLLLVSNTYAVGIRGIILKDTIMFEPGLSKTYNFKLVSYSSKDQNYNISIRSKSGNENLTQYLTTSETNVFVPAGAVYPFKAYLNLPNKIETPGWHDLRIRVSETSSGSGNIGALTASEATIKILVLFPYKYIEGIVTATNININQSTHIKISVNNYGTPKINNIYANLNIYDKDKNFIKTIKTNSISLESKENGELTTSFTPNIVGDYIINATIFYDGNNITTNTSFRTGDLNIFINDFTTKFIAKKIDSMNIAVENGWNEIIENVYSIITIYNGTNKLTSVRSSSIDLGPFQFSKISSFVDFSKIPEGNYTANVKIFYGGKTKSKTKNIEVYIPKVPVVEEPKSFSLSTNTLIMIILGFNMLLFIIIILLFVNKKK